MNFKVLLAQRALWSRRLVLLGFPVCLLWVLWPSPKLAEPELANAWLPPVELKENIRVTQHMAATPKPPMTNEAALHLGVQRWRETWSAKDVPTDLSLYSPDFVPPKGMTRQQWAESRGGRVSGKEPITLTVQNVRLHIMGAQAVSIFFQIYTDAGLRTRKKTTMVWQKRDGQWLIQSEKTD